LNRVADWALDRHPRDREALKAAKRKLHQVHGAYLLDLDFDRIATEIDRLPPDADVEAARKLSKEVLESHASTAERLEILDRIYVDLFQITGPPTSVLDVACGLNPFSLPWMHLQPGVPYRAIDIDGRLITLADRFLARARPGAIAECRDVLDGSCRLEADVVLMMKSLPCLEQQRGGAAVELLSRITARRIAVSFPTRSLGGLEKGMAEHYAAIVSRIADASGYEVQRISYPTETVYVLGR
jgi:16S rRNA (guanine(1405)-N(7))-methyltransferase